MRGQHLDLLIADFDDAIATLEEHLRGAPGVWTQARPGKWTAGQHAEHLAMALHVTAEALDANAARLREGTLPRRPIRGPLQITFVMIAVGAGRFPRGGRASKNVIPTARPDRLETMARIARDAERHRAIGKALAIADRDRLWIPNPFMKGWTYTYPEILRMHAVHFRHHTQQVMEISGA